VVDRVRAEMALARSEAVFRRRQVTVCRSPDGMNCTWSGPWSAGTLTFEDRDLDQMRDPHEPVLRVTTAADYGGMHLVDVGRRRHVSFRPDGRSAGTNITLKLCSRRMDPLRLLVVNVGGRVRVAKPGPDLSRCGE
jgi:type IV fimbrial biogenesis protein FimT